VITGGYSLDLYCDNEKSCKLRKKYSWASSTDQYIGETRQQCYDQARKDGWRLSRDRKAYCPLCEGVRK
jgi:hypothetical protein